MITNQHFCYWLQGYFEISTTVDLTKDKVLLIENSLNNINEPLGLFTGWLKAILDYFREVDYNAGLLNYFLPEIQFRLNAIFFHVIDNSYGTRNLAEAQKIHDGQPI